MFLLQSLKIWLPLPLRLQVLAGSRVALVPHSRHQLWQICNFRYNHDVTHENVAFSASGAHFTDRCQALLNILSLQFSVVVFFFLFSFFGIPEKVLSENRRILTHLSTHSATTRFPVKLLVMGWLQNYSEFAWPVTLWRRCTTLSKENSQS